MIISRRISSIFFRLIFFFSVYELYCTCELCSMRLTLYHNIMQYTYKYTITHGRQGNTFISHTFCFCFFLTIKAILSSRAHFVYFFSLGQLISISSSSSRSTHIFLKNDIFYLLVHLFGRRPSSSPLQSCYLITRVHIHLFLSLSLPPR